MQEYTCGFVFDQYYKRVLLIQKQRPEWQKGKLNGIGGKIEFGETPLQAMLREWYEETHFELYEECLTNFATLICQDDTWDKECIIHFYSGSLSNAEFDGFLEFIETQTYDEEIYCVTVKSLPLLNTLTNLKWLIPMAINDWNTYQILEGR